MSRASFGIALAAAALLAGCHAHAPDGPVASDAWVRLAAVPGRPAAAYFKLRGGAAADRLVAVASPAATRAELHEGGMEGSMMTMRPLRGIDLAPGGEVTFAPGGDHVMLFGLDPALQSGGTMPLRFRFRSGATRTAQARLVAAGDPAPGG